MSKIFKIRTVFLILTISALLLAGIVYADMPEDMPIAQKLSITVTNGYKNFPEYTDGTDTTFNSIGSERTISVIADGDIGYLYLRWKSTPYPWTLTYNDVSVECGQNGYYHEVVRIPEGVSEVSITAHCPTEQTLNDIEAYTAGILPENVQDWQAPCEKADLLVLPTHSDDEFVFLGGVIPTYTDRGYAVQVCYLIDHRTNERLDSLWEAGVRNYPITSGKADLVFDNDYARVYAYLNPDFVNAYITAQIRRFHPSVIVGQAEDGDSGHYHHQIYVRQLKEALELANDPNYMPDTCIGLELWDTPKTYLHRYGANPLVMDYETPLEHFGGRTAFQVAEDAFAKCVTQKAAARYTVYGSDSQHDVHLLGLYRSTVGEDVLRNDLFENIPA